MNTRSKLLACNKEQFVFTRRELENLLNQIYDSGQNRTLLPVDTESDYTNSSSYYNENSFAANDVIAPYCIDYDSIGRIIIVNF